MKLSDSKVNFYYDNCGAACDDIEFMLDLLGEAHKEAVDGDLCMSDEWIESVERCLDPENT